VPERTRSGEGLSSQGFRCLKGGGLSGKRGLRVSICVDASWEASRVTGTSRVTQVMMLLKIRDTEVLAHYLFSRIVTKADYHIDLRGATFLSLMWFTVSIQPMQVTRSIASAGRCHVLAVTNISKHVCLDQAV